MNKLTPIDNFPDRKLPQERFDEKVRISMDQLSNMVDEINDQVIPTLSVITPPPQSDSELFLKSNGTWETPPQPTTEIQSIQTQLTNVQTQLTNVKTTADNALPKSGGNITGQLNINSSSNIIVTVKNTELVKNEVSNTNKNTTINLVDKNNKLLGALGNVNTYDGKSVCYIGISSPDEFTPATIGVGYTKDGVPFTNSQTASIYSYGEEIVTTKWFCDRAILRAVTTTFYVGGANASDTADLFKGRGESPDKPFATLDNCLRFIFYSIFTGHNIVIILQSNQKLDYYSIRTGQHMVIRSDTTRRVLELPSSVFDGTLILENIHIKVDYIILDGYFKKSALEFYNCHIEALDSTKILLQAVNDGRIVLNSTNISGNCMGLVSILRGSKFYITNNMVVDITNNTWYAFNIQEHSNIYINGTVTGNYNGAKLRLANYSYSSMLPISHIQIGTGIDIDSTSAAY